MKKAERPTSTDRVREQIEPYAKGEMPSFRSLSDEQYEIIDGVRYDLTPSPTLDKIIKKELYARFHIKEYWIVDPVHFTVDQLILNNSRYDLYRTFAPN